MAFFPPPEPWTAIKTYAGFVNSGDMQRKKKSPLVPDFWSHGVPFACPQGHKTVPASYILLPQGCLVIHTLIRAFFPEVFSVANSLFSESALSCVLLRREQLLCRYLISGEWQNSGGSTIAPCSDLKSLKKWSHIENKLAVTNGERQVGRGNGGVGN